MNEPKENPFTKSLGRITWVLAFLIAFTLLPVGYGLSHDWVMGIAHIYSRSEGFLAFVSLGWMVLVGILIFSVMRATLSALLALLGLALVLLFSRDRD